MTRSLLVSGRPSDQPADETPPVAPVAPLWARAFLFVRAHRAILVWTVLLFVGALWVRLPNLLLIPRYTDEGLEVLWGWDIARGLRLPLTAVDAYDGPLFAYLVAAFFRLLGPSVLLPRLMIAVSSALTVPLTYYLGRSMWNHLAGLIAAVLVLTSPTLVINSHVGISNGLTPFLCTLTLLALWNGVVRNQPRLLAVSGLFAALALQSHPLAIIPLAGMVVWFLLRRDLKARLHRAAPYWAVGLFVLGYLPMLIANLKPGIPMLAVAAHRDYAFGPTLAPLDYAQRVFGLLLNLAVLIPGQAGWRLIPPAVVVLDLLLLAGLVLAWRQGKGLLVAVALSTLILFPFISQNPAPRYIAYLVPVCSVAAGGAIMQGLQALRRVSMTPRYLSAGILAGVSVAVLLLPVSHLYTISKRYADAVAGGQTNEGLYKLVDVVQSAGACGEGVLVENVGYARAGFGTYYTSQALDYIFTLQSCKHRFSSIQKLVAHLPPPGNQGWLIIRGTSLTAFSRLVSFEPVMTINPYQDQGAQPFVLYRITTLP